jgi:type I restriction enzyme, S subunit
MPYGGGPVQRDMGASLGATEVNEMLQKMRLGECLTLINGRAYKRSELLDEGTPVIRIQNLNGGKNWYYSDLELPEDKYCSKGDLLFAWSATFGPFFWNGDRGIYHYHIWKVIPNDQYLNGRYAYYMLQSITAKIKSAAHGSSMPHYGKGFMEKLEVSLPPIDEQKRIAAILDKANEIEVAVKITHNKQRDMIHSTFLEMFGDPNLNPMNWDENTLESLCVEKVGVKAGPFGSSLKKEMYSEMGYKIYGQEQVIAGDHTIGDYYIPEDVYQKLQSCKVESGDLLISLVGSIGRTLVIPNDFESGIINPRLLRIRTRRELIHPDFLKVFLALPEIQLRLMGNSHEQTMPVLNGRIMKKISIITPPLSLQEKFLESLNNIEKMSQRSDRMMNESSKLSKAITQDLLS